MRPLMSNIGNTRTRLVTKAVIIKYNSRDMRGRFQGVSVGLTGFTIAATAEMIMVRKMVRIPLLKVLSHGVTAHNPLSRKLTATATATALSFREGGMMIAINIPYRATLRADTIPAGNTLPAMMPQYVPKAQMDRKPAMERDRQSRYRKSHRSYNIPPEYDATAKCQV